MRKTTLGRELKALNGKYGSESKMRKTTLDRELKALNGKEDSRS